MPQFGEEREKPFNEEERARVLGWLAMYGQKIADGMFRDTNLFYDEECRKEEKESVSSKTA